MEDVDYLLLNPIAREEGGSDVNELEKINCIVTKASRRCTDAGDSTRVEPWETCLAT